MPYQQITVNVNDAVAERLADALMEHGALSATIEDAYAYTQNEQAIFGEPGMPTEQIGSRAKSSPCSANTTKPPPSFKPPHKNAD